MNNPKIVPYSNQPKIGFTNSFIQDYSILNIVFPIYGACEYGEVELGESYVEMNYGQKPIVSYKAFNYNINTTYNKPNIVVNNKNKPRVC